MARHRPGWRRRLCCGLVLAATLSMAGAQDANATAPAAAPAPAPPAADANASSPAPAPAPAPAPMPTPPPRPSGPILFATPSPGCAGENVTVYNGMYANEGGGKQTLATLAWELAGRTCGGPASDAGRALLAANPQFGGNPNALLAANEPVCVPAGLAGAVARASPDPRSPRARPADDGGVPGVRGPPPGCPRADIRYADGGTTPAALVGEPPCGGAGAVFGSAPPGSPPTSPGHNGTLAALRALNAYAPGSPDVPLPDGAVVCVDLVSGQALLAAQAAAAAAAAPPPPATNNATSNETAPAPAPAPAAATNETVSAAPAAAPAPEPAPANATGPASSR